MNNIENLKDLIIYQSQNNENISVEVLYNEEDFWLTQKSMSKLFNVAENNITYHLQNIFKTEELEENRTTQKIRVVQKEGNRNVSFGKDYFDELLVKIKEIRASERRFYQKITERLIKDKNIVIFKLPFLKMRRLKIIKLS